MPHCRAVQQAIAKKKNTKSKPKKRKDFQEAKDITVIELLNIHSIVSRSDSSRDFQIS